MCGLNESGFMDGRACDHLAGGYTSPRICTQTSLHALICNRRNKGTAVLLIPGGASEALLSEPGFYNIVGALFSYFWHAGLLLWWHAVGPHYFLRCGGCLACEVSHATCFLNASHLTFQ